MANPARKRRVEASSPSRESTSRFVPPDLACVPPGTAGATALIEVHSGVCSRLRAGVGSTGTEEIAAAVLNSACSALAKTAVFVGRRGWLAVSLIVTDPLTGDYFEPLHDFVKKKLESLDNKPVEDCTVLVADRHRFAAGIRAEWLVSENAVLGSPSAKFLDDLTELTKLHISRYVEKKKQATQGKRGQEQRQDVDESSVLRRAAIERPRLSPERERLRAKAQKFAACLVSEEADLAKVVRLKAGLDKAYRNLIDKESPPPSGKRKSEASVAENQADAGTLKAKDKRDIQPPRTGHPLIVKLASLWDQRETLPRPQFVEQFQKLLDSFHKTKNLGSYELNDTATRWINKIAYKNNIHLMINDETAVRIRCFKRGDGYFQPLRATRSQEAIPQKGSRAFHRLKLLAY